MRLKRFQSTLRRTERRYQYVYDDVTIGVSIHAPTNGATTAYDTNNIDTQKQFQSTLRRTERLTTVSAEQTYTQFQSTLRRTERQGYIVARDGMTQFQSTLRRTERLQYGGVYR